MNKSKCPVCGSSHTVKNGVRKGMQTYLCRDCGHRFRNNPMPSEADIWRMYQQGKQTLAELASSLNTSVSTVKRRLRGVSKEWEQPSLSGEGFVHMDATYWGRDNGILLALDSQTSAVLYLAFIKHERVSDYVDAVRSIERRGYQIKGVIIDGMQSLFAQLSGYRIQMCQFHMKQIVRRYITLNPKLLAARALKELMGNLTVMGKDDFERAYDNWKKEWAGTLNKRSEQKDGKRRYRHRRLRSAMHSVDFYLPYLFTFQSPDCVGMPNTNNKIEGTFTDLKKNLNNHSGMSEENRKRFINGSFLASKGL